MAQNITKSGNHSQVSWLDTVVDIVKTDNFVNQEHEDDIRMHLVFAATVLFVILVNGYVLYWLKKKDRTLVDSMIWHDCIANMGGMLAMLLIYPRQINKMLDNFGIFFNIFEISYLNSSNYM